MAATGNGRWCPCCGEECSTARCVTGMRGLVFCGIVCHDKWDRVFNGIDRRPTPDLMKKLRLLAELEESGFIDETQVGRLVLSYLRENAS